MTKPTIARIWRGRTTRARDDEYAAYLYEVGIKPLEEKFYPAADNLKFLGKTPLTDAVKQAAEALKYTEDKATVILITDGLETCSADPCALAKELEQSGVDFTTHVVGFDVSAHLGNARSAVRKAGPTPLLRLRS